MDGKSGFKVSDDLSSSLSALIGPERLLLSRRQNPLNGARHIARGKHKREGVSVGDF